MKPKTKGQYPLDWNTYRIEETGKKEAKWFLRIFYVLLFALLIFVALVP